MGQILQSDRVWGHDLTSIPLQGHGDFSHHLCLPGALCLLPPSPFCFPSYPLNLLSKGHLGGPGNKNMGSGALGDVSPAQCLVDWGWAGRTPFLLGQ